MPNSYRQGINEWRAAVRRRAGTNARGPGRRPLLRLALVARGPWVLSVSIPTSVAIGGQTSVAAASRSPISICVALLCSGYHLLSDGVNRVRGTPSVSPTAISPLRPGRRPPSNSPAANRVPTMRRACARMRRSTDGSTGAGTRAAVAAAAGGTPGLSASWCRASRAS